MPHIKFLNYLLSKYPTTFDLSWNLTQICHYIKKNSELKQPFSILFSKLFLLIKGKFPGLDKDSLYYFLLFKSSLAKLIEYSYGSKETLIQYEKILNVLTSIYKDYEIFDPFMQIFETNSQQYIRKNYIFLETISKKFGFSSKNDAINHLETLLRRFAPINKKNINYITFKEIISQTYEMNIERKEIFEELQSFFIGKEEVCFEELLKNLKDSLLIEFFMLHVLVLETLCLVNLKNKNIMDQTFFQEAFKKRTLFRYSEFVKEFEGSYENVEKEYHPLIFSSLHYENNFLKIYDVFKKKKLKFLNSFDTDEEKLEFTKEGIGLLSLLDMGDFYNKSKMNSNFEEFLEFLNFIQTFTFAYNPPKKIIKSRIKNVTLSNFSERSGSSDSSKKNKRKSLQKRVSIKLKNTTSSPRKSTITNPFLGIQMILAKKPFRKSIIQAKT